MTGQCLTLPENSLCGSQFKGYPVFASSIDAFNSMLQTNVINSATFVSDIDTSSKCGKGKNPSGLRYTITMQCYLATRLAIEKSCKPSLPSNNLNVCPSICNAAETTLSSYVCNSSLRTSQMYRETCRNSSNPTSCLGPVEQEIGTCGFFSVTEASTFCSASNDLCCTQLVYPNKWLSPLLWSSLTALFLFSLGTLFYWKRNWITSRLNNLVAGPKNHFEILESGKDIRPVSVDPYYSSTRSVPSPVFSVTHPVAAHTSQGMFYPAEGSIISGYPEGSVILDSFSTHQVLYLDHQPLSPLMGGQYDTLCSSTDINQNQEPLMFMPMYVDAEGRCFMVYHPPSPTHSEIGFVDTTERSASSNSITHSEERNTSPFQEEAQIVQESGNEKITAMPNLTKEEYSAPPIQETHPSEEINTKGMKILRKPVQKTFQVGEIVKVVKEYTATLPDELSISPEQLVEILVLYHDGWAMGRVKTNELKVGVFPLCYTEFAQGTKPTPATRAQSLRKK
jgi:hypothetical protein